MWLSRIKKFWDFCRNYNYIIWARIEQHASVYISGCSSSESRSVDRNKLEDRAICVQLESAANAFLLGVYSDWSSLSVSHFARCKYVAQELAMLCLQGYI